VEAATTTIQVIVTSYFIISCINSKLWEIYLITRWADALPQCPGVQPPHQRTPWGVVWRVTYL